jgi:hypothetical protein
MVKYVSYNKRFKVNYVKNKMNIEENTHAMNF